MMISMGVWETKMSEHWTAYAKIISSSSLGEGAMGNTLLIVLLHDSAVWLYFSMVFGSIDVVFAVVMTSVEQWNAQPETSDEFAVVYCSMIRCVFTRL